VTVAPGTRIAWTNRDEVPHTVVSKDKALASKGLDTGDSFEYAFAAEGDYSYYCSVHPFMTGVVHVRKP
jgi:plastocyanin